MMFNIVGIVKLIDGHKTCVIALKNVVMPTQAQEYFAKTRSVLQTPYWILETFLDNNAS